MMASYHFVYAFYRPRVQWLVTIWALCFASQAWGDDITGLCKQLNQENQEIEKQMEQLDPSEPATMTLKSRYMQNQLQSIRIDCPYKPKDKPFKRLIDEAQREFDAAEAAYQKCLHERKDCHQIERARLNLATVYLNLTFFLGNDNDEEKAKQLIRSGRLTGPENLLHLIKTLIAQGVDPASIEDLLYVLVAQLMNNQPDQASFIHRLLVAIRSHDLGFLRVLRLQVERLRRNNPSLVPESLVDELGKKYPDPNRVTKLLFELDQKNLELVFDSSQAIEQARRRAAVLADRYQSGLLVAVSISPGIKQNCPAAQSFLRRLEEALTPDPSLGLPAPVVLHTWDAEREINQLLCCCNMLSNCQTKDKTSSFDPTTCQHRVCDAVLHVRLSEDPLGVTAEGSLYLVIPGNLSPNRYEKYRRTISGIGGFSCLDSGEGADYEIATVDFLEDMRYKLDILASLPVLTEKCPSLQSEPPSAWNAMLLAGAPQLMDNRIDNDTPGWWLAMTDALLTGSSITLLGFSIYARNEYSRGNGDLHHANTLLVAGSVALSTVLIGRIISALTYDPM